LEKACRDRADDMNKLNSAFKKYDDRVKEICSKPEFAVFFSKTPCYGKDVTFQQLTDSSKINKEQKSILPNIRALLDSETKEINAARRNYGGDILTRSVEYIETTQVEIDKYNLDLYNGLITWGIYNQRRKELAAKMNAELSRIAQSMH